MGKKNTLSLGILCFSANISIGTFGKMKLKRVYDHEQLSLPVLFCLFTTTLLENFLAIVLLASL